MGASTGPVLAAVAVVVGNAVIIHDQTWASQARTVVGGAVVAGGLSLMEKPFPAASTAFAWLVLASVLLVRVNPNVPSPLESFAAWWGVPMGQPAGIASSRPFK